MQLKHPELSQLQAQLVQMQLVIWEQLQFLQEDRLFAGLVEEQVMVETEAQEHIMIVQRWRDIQELRVLMQLVEVEAVHPAEAVPVENPKVQLADGTIAIAITVVPVRLVVMLVHLLVLVQLLWVVVVEMEEMVEEAVAMEMMIAAVSQLELLLPEVVQVREEAEVMVQQVLQGPVEVKEVMVI